MELETIWDGNVHAPDRGSLDFVRGVDERDRVTFPKRMPPTRSYARHRYSFTTERVRQCIEEIQKLLDAAGAKGVTVVEIREVTQHLAGEHYLFEILNYLREQGFLHRTRELRIHRYFSVGAAQEPL